MFKFFGLNKFLSYRYFYNTTKVIVAPAFGAACFFALYAGYLALFLAPVDAQQGPVYLIMYVHVPLAFMSLALYSAMTVAAFIYCVWQIKIADIFIRAAAPIGALYTLLVLLTGSIWGKPTWGTWWIWDARLTSELILLFIYTGVIALRQALPESTISNKIVAFWVIIGALDIPVIHYSVQWWYTLHQGPSLLKVSGPSIDGSMMYPLVLMFVALFFYSFAIICCFMYANMLKINKNISWVLR